MQNTESSKHFIKKITKEYRKEIIYESNMSVLSLVDHFNKIIAKVMNINKDFVILTKQ